MDNQQDFLAKKFGLSKIFEIYPKILNDESIVETRINNDFIPESSSWPELALNVSCLALGVM